MHSANFTDLAAPDPAAAPAPAPAGASSADIAGIGGIADMEEALRQILQAVSDGHDDRIGPLVEQLGNLIHSVGPADKAGAARPQDLRRVRDLWRQTTLALASASQQASAELQRIAAGRSALRAYRW
jgi:hypothetical protein